MSSQPLQSLALARGTVDRAARHRADDAWLDDRWSDRSTQVLVVDDGTVAVTGDPPALRLSAPGDVPPTDSPHRWFLGLDADGIALFAVSAPLDRPGEAATLREIGALLSDRDAGLLTHRRGAGGLACHPRPLPAVWIADRRRRGRHGAGVHA